MVTPARPPGTCGESPGGRSLPAAGRAGPAREQRFSPRQVAAAVALTAMWTAVAGFGEGLPLADLHYMTVPEVFVATVTLCAVIWVAAVSGRRNHEAVYEQFRAGVRAAAATAVEDAAGAALEAVSAFARDHPPGSAGRGLLHPVPRDYPDGER